MTECLLFHEDVSTENTFALTLRLLPIAYTIHIIVIVASSTRPTPLSVSHGALDVLFNYKNRLLLWRTALYLEHRAPPQPTCRPIRSWLSPLRLEWQRATTWTRCIRQTRPGCTRTTNDGIPVSCNSGVSSTPNTRNTANR